MYFTTAVILRNAFEIVLCNIDQFVAWSVSHCVVKKNL